ncbi:MAG TPA: hypothetical protein VFI30_00030 [Nocardioidaceae bacterium]|nr:hypothetical protein [Nocardioidaceae bacterium]
MSCTLGPTGAIHHVIYIQFDNTHLARTNPNLPSDIQQMPALLSFMRRNGTVLNNDHTPLIAHTANDLVTSETGLYPNQQGIPEANSYRYYLPDGTTDTAGSFSYWTDPVDSYTTADGLGPDHNYNLLTAAGKNTPAPWVPLTRAGCNVGEVALANLDLENAAPDVGIVFGANSPEAQDAANPDFPTQTEYEGLSVHCALHSAFCADNPRPVADRLPDEPGGYHGYQAVFGAKYLDGELSPNGPLTNLDGAVITDSNGLPGFPGYDSMQPVNALAYTLDMQTHGVPVTYTYLTDVHDNAVTGDGMGPGEATYESQLQAYNQGLATFFKDLAAAGITPRNTLFVFGEEENDHYVGSAPSPTNCDGVTVPCTYGQLGEVGLNVQGLLATQQHVTTQFAVHSDSAPFVYLDGQPGRTAPAVRTFGRALARLRAVDPYRQQTVRLTHYLADPVELRVLHMITADPARTPTFTLFANPDFYLYADGTSCTTANCESYQTDVWNHGDVSPDINRSWMAFDGPGVRRLGASSVWASETDTRPTLMSLLGLRDDYAHEGRVLTGIIQPGSLPASLAGGAYGQLAAAYTSIESPVAPFSLATLRLSTRAIASGRPGHDQTYRRDEQAIRALGTARDRLGSQMITLLEDAAFHGQRIPPWQATSLARRAHALTATAERLAG